MRCTVGSGAKTPEAAWGISENFCVKSNLTVCKVTLTVSYRKNWEAGCTTYSRNNFVWGARERMSPTPCSHPYVSKFLDTTL